MKITISLKVIDAAWLRSLFAFSNAMFGSSPFLKNVSFSLFQYEKKEGKHASYIVYGWNTQTIFLTFVFFHVRLLLLAEVIRRRQETELCLHFSLLEDGLEKCYRI